MTPSYYKSTLIATLAECYKMHKNPVSITVDVMSMQAPFVIVHFSHAYSGSAVRPDDKDIREIFRGVKREKLIKETNKAIKNFLEKNKISYLTFEPATPSSNAVVTLSPCCDQ